jgi:acetyltransferase-like isoleucine patch superfamily enzyme
MSAPFAEAPAAVPYRPGLAVAATRRSRFRARLRHVGLIATALLPQPAKRWAYRWCFGYRIGRRASIGIAYLDCAELTVADGARVSHGCVFLRCGKVHVGAEAVVGPLNLFRGGGEIRLGAFSQVLRLNIINAIPEHDCVNDPDSTFHLGEGAVVTSEHRIDFTDRVAIGRCSILGGRNSSIWTHNRRKGSPVTVGDYCYLGSEIRMAPGSAVPAYCVVGLGSVVTRPLGEPYSLIAGVPARRQRSLSVEDEELIFGRTRPDLPEELQAPRRRAAPEL